MRGISILVAVLVSLVALPVHAADVPAQVSSIGVVANGGVDRDGRAWFELSRTDQRFVIDSAAGVQAVFNVLKQSNQTGRSVTVHYDPHGDFRDGGDKPTYIVRDLVYMDTTITGTNVPSPLGTETGATEAALALGVALYQNGDSAPAHDQLARALGDTTLRTPLRALAAKTDSSALSDQAFNHLGPGLDRDRLLIAALAASREWKKNAPNDFYADLDIATDLTNLGDYDAAIAIMSAIVTKWPKDSFWTYIHMGAVFRARQQYTLALGALDELVATLGPQDGMAYHYHRGWTLEEMHRYDEAIAEFTTGLKSQPDFLWAMLRRSCAEAGLGHLADAVKDHEQALTMLEASTAKQPATPSSDQDLARARAVMATLRNGLASAPNQKIEGLCAGYSDYGDAYRDRSPLLPPAK